MQNKIVFFSSDARKVYKDDIYRVISLPEGYIIEFRYALKYISDNLKINLTDMANKEAIIFHSYNENKEFISVRKAIIKEAKKESDIVFFYLELKEFVNYDIEKYDNLDNNIFVNEINIVNKNNNKFYNIVDNLKKSFEDNVFFNIRDILDNKGNVIECKYDSIMNESYYEIEEEGRYTIRVEFYNYDSNGDCFEIESSVSELNIHQNKIISLDGKRNIENIKFRTKSINIKDEDVVVNFCNCSEGNNKKGVRVVPINIKIKRKSNRAVALALGTGVASLAIFLAQYIVRQQLGWMWLLIPAILSAVSAYWLYDKLNKK